MVACCARVIVVAGSPMRMTIRLVVGIVSPVRVAVAVLLVAITLISITLLVTDSIFQRINLVLKSG